MWDKHNAGSHASLIKISLLVRLWKSHRLHIKPRGIYKYVVVVCSLNVPLGKYRIDSRQRPKHSVDIQFPFELF